MSPIADYARSWRPYGAVLGVCAAGAALSMPHTAVGSVMWAAALVCAVIGYGRAFDRVTRQCSPVGVAAVVGLACMLIASCVLARLGALTRDVQIGIVVAGCVSGAIPSPDGGASRKVPLAIFVIAGLLGALLVVLAYVHFGSEWIALTSDNDRSATELQPFASAISDGANHTFLVKRLLDTGHLGVVYHQLGAQVVGESYTAVIGGAHALGLFDAGLCAPLVLLVVASELAERAKATAAVFFVLIGLGIAFDVAVAAPDTAPWSAILLVVAMVASLRRSAGEPRTAFTLVVLALGLVSVRYEYAAFALPFLIAYFVRPQRPRAIALLAAASVALCFVAQVLPGARGFHVGSAIASSAVVLLVFPAAWLVNAALNNRASQRTVMIFVVAALVCLITEDREIVPGALQGNAMTTVLWHAALICALLGISDAPSDGADSIPGGRLIPTAAMIALWLFTMFPIPPMRSDRMDPIERRFIYTFVALRDLREHTQFDEDERIHLLQEQVPAGKRIGFWGQSAARLDFARNPIVDLSWPAGSKQWRLGFLTPLVPDRARGVDYLIVESLHPASSATVEDAYWSAPPPPPTAKVDAMLEPIATSAAARLFRLRQ